MSRLEVGSRSESWYRAETKQEIARLIRRGLKKGIPLDRSKFRVICAAVEELEAEWLAQFGAQP